MPASREKDGCTKLRKPCWRGSWRTGKPGKKKVMNSRGSCRATLRSRRQVCYGPPQGRKSYPTLLIVNQRPLGRAGMAQPVVLHVPWLLFCTEKRWDRRFTGLGEPPGFYQEELAFPQSQKRPVTLCIGAMTEHGNNYSRVLRNLSKGARIQSSRHVVCQASIS